MRSTALPASASARSNLTASRKSPSAGSGLGSSGRPKPSSIHRAEMDQLHSFIKQRGQTVDEEIMGLSEKIKSTERGKQALAASSSSRRSGSVENDSLQNVAEHSELRMTGTGLGKVQLNAGQILEESKRAAPKLASTSQLLQSVRRPAQEADQLVTFLAKLKLKAEDAGISGRDLRELLLADDLSMPGEYWVPVEEVTNVLQTDLLMPITKPDQRLLLEEYGAADGMVDVQGLLLDAGLWDDGDSPDRFSSMLSSPLRGDGLVDAAPHSPGMDSLPSMPLSPSPSPPRETLRSNRLFAESLPAQTFREKQTLLGTEEVNRQTNRNLDELAALHDLIMEDDDFDNIDRLKKKGPDVAGIAAVPQSPSKEQVRNSIRAKHSHTARSIASPADTPQRHSGSVNMVDSVGIADTAYESKKLQELAEENMRLKQEMRSFDGEFFEQLEDLKNRYSKLQEVLGEDPLVRAKVNARMKEGPLPLDKLPWSTRRSMTAMDRASLDSPLVVGPRVAHAYTYAPGSKTNYHDEGMHLGGSLSASQAENKAYMMESMGRGPTKAPVRGFDSIRSGGTHGIGAGTYQFISGDAEGTTGSLANLCERRLAFELSSHPKPDDAILTLISRIGDMGDMNRAAALKNGDELSADRFITVPQLHNCLFYVKLQMSEEEVKVLASGFASNGKGGVNCDEFCNMVQSIAYNLLGNYAHTFSDSGTRRADKNQYRRRKGAEDYEDEDALHDKHFQQVLRELCDSIITFDKRSVLGASSNFSQTLLKPFVEFDSRGSGWVLFHEFKQILREFGAMLSAEEYAILARPFLLVDERKPVQHDFNEIQAFRDAKLTGSLTAHSKGAPRFADFLTSHGLEGTITQEEKQNSLTDDSMVDYVDFVEVLARMLGSLLDEKGGLPIVPKLPWIMKEFDFVDVLLSQLESMKSNTRRKTLITLQYALENADSREVGELDGFALLTALINCGFRLQRYERVQLLRAAEEYGGALEYSRLVLVLLQTTIDWTQSERDIVYKILKAMGITVEQRRNWLARLKKELIDRTTQQKMKLKAKEQANAAATMRQSLLQPSSDQADRSYDIPPAVFLHVLRDLHVDLTPEEEAVLLDCLDTERIAKLQAKKLNTHISNPKDKKKALWNSASNNPSSNGNNEFSLPSVDYQSFVTFCARHCGSWIDSSPKLYDAIHGNLQTIHYPLQALQEFVLLCKSFDELSTGYISHRAFLIACNRSTLFAAVSEDHINELANNLSIEGAGEIEYKTFCLQLRGICASVQQDNGKHSTIHASGLSIIQQIIKNAADNHNPSISSTLLPLRKWLMMHSDVQSLILTLKEFNALLREFSVIYRPEDLELLFMEIGYDLDQHASYGLSQRRGNGSRIIGSLDDLSMPSESHNRVRVVSTKKLLQVLNMHRDSWVVRHPALARQLMKALQAMPVEGNDKAPNNNSSLATSHVALAVMKVISRLEAFSISMEHMDGNDEDDVPRSTALNTRHSKNVLSNVDNLDSKTASLLAKHPLDASGQHHQKLIEIDVFDYLLRSMGIHLHKTDLLFLADASDPNPEANFINIYLLFDILRRNMQSDRTEDMYQGLQGEGHGDAMEEEYDDLLDSARYALDHLQGLIWKAMSQTTSLKPMDPKSKASATTSALTTRTPLEWINDVKCVFQGFDAYNNGLITLQDFVLALHCLSIKMSMDLIKDMVPYVGATPTGPVQYKKILSYVLSTSPYTQQGRQTKHMEEQEHRQLAVAARTAKGSSAKKEAHTADAAVSKLLHVVRRNICIKQLILNNQHLEEAWMDLLRVFHTFDSNETNRVSARDFCLAVSVLLNGKPEENSAKQRRTSSEDIILSKADWEQVIDFFTVSAQPNKGLKQPTNNRGELLLVDYMLFCELVLDPKEVSTRLRELANSPDVRHLRMEFAKENMLSKKPSTPMQVSGRSVSTSAAARRQEVNDPVSSHSVSLNKKFYSYEDDRSASSNTSGRYSHTSSPNARPRDPIADKFAKAQDKHKHSTAFGRSYNPSDQNRSPNSHRRVGEPADNDYSGLRVGNTQGQSSRDNAHHRGSLSKTAGGNMRTLGSYTQQGMDDRSGRSKVRFNWTVG